MTDTQDFIPDPDEEVVEAEQLAPVAKDDVRSLWSDAWRELRRNPMFWVSVVLIALLIAMAIAPSLFTRLDPELCDLHRARQKPSAEAIFGYDLQGCDVYARTIYGARSSILVGVLTTALTVILGSFLGIIAGYFGGIVDTLLSRLGDIFFGIPLLLGGMIILFTLKTPPGTPYLIVVLKVVLAMAVLGWPRILRLMRSSVLQVKPQDYIQAARALGAGPARIIVSHVLPNSIAAVTVVGTIDLGTYIATEATLSFLGIGLQPPAISWGLAVSEASGLGYIKAAPHMLLFPSLFLSVTVLAFIMLGESIRTALDPKLR